MKRGVIALMTVALLLSACHKKSTLPVTPTPTPAPTTSSSPLATTVTVMLTFQGTPQNGVNVIESATYNYTTNTPGATITQGITSGQGAVALAFGTPTGPYCFSASYTPAGQTSAVNVANCQPSVSANETITLGN